MSFPSPFYPHITHVNNFLALLFFVYVLFDILAATHTVPLATYFFEFAPGAIGGFCNVLVGQPMDRVKVMQQSVMMTTTTTTTPASSHSNNTATTTTTTSTATTTTTAATRRRVAATLATGNSTLSTTGMLRNIIQQEGLSGLYRGVASPLLAVTPAFAISFWSCDLAKTLIVDYNNNKNNNNTMTKNDLSIGQVAAVGAFSGFPLSLVLGPSERIKCLMQVDKQKSYNGFLDCASKVYAEGGMASVFRGTGSAALRDVPGNAAYFAGYEFCKRQLCVLEGRNTPSTPSILLAGGMAGVANWIVAIPFDTLKSRIQTAPAGQYSSYIDVLRQTVQKEGVQALFRGLTPALLRAFPANAACLLGVETARSCFSSFR